MILKKFVPKRTEKEVISMRIPSQVLEKLDKKAAEYEISRNELINQCITFALDNLDDKQLQK